MIIVLKVSTTEKESGGINMNCPKCGGEDVNVQLVQVSEKTKKSGVGFGGHMNNMARGLTAVCTLGMSNLVWKKAKGTEKSKVQNQKVCVCQSCGYSWLLE